MCALINHAFSYAVSPATVARKSCQYLFQGVIQNLLLGFGLLWPETVTLSGGTQPFTLCRPGLQLCF